MVEKITAVAVMGIVKHNEWVIKYDLHLSDDMSLWNQFINIEGNIDKVNKVL